MSTENVLTILAVLVAAFFGLKLRSSKKELSKSEERAMRAESDLYLNKMEMMVEETRRKSEEARRNYRGDSDTKH